jgi:hypothetical protein
LRAYSGLERLGYQVNHSRNFKDPYTGVHRNFIQGAWSADKQNYQVSKKENNALEGSL